MANIISVPLTLGYYSTIDEEDDWVLKFKWHVIIQKATLTPYAVRNFTNTNGKATTQRLHRIIMGDSCAGFDVDHIDGNGLNNRRNNLRIVTRTINNRNFKPHRINNTSGIIGICFDKNRNKWVSKIQVNNKTINLGRFNTMEEAVNARREAEIKLWGIEPQRATFLTRLEEE